MQNNLKEIRVLTSLRFLGSIWVVLYHFKPQINSAFPKLSFLDPLLSQGNFGVTFFFLLSGFIIQHNYGFRGNFTIRSFLRFMIKRINRLFPVNLVTQMAAVPVVYWGVVNQNNWGAPKPDWFNLEGLLKAIFMLQELGQKTPVYSWNQPSWSLFGEVLAYIFYPLVLALLFVVVKRVKVAGVYFLLGLLIVYYAEYLLPGSYPFSFVIYLVLIFIAGVVMRLSIGEWKRFKITKYLEVVPYVLVLYSCYLGETDFIAIALYLLVFISATANGPISKLLETAPFYLAGKFSYSLYMSHWVVFGYFYIFLHYNSNLKEYFLALYSLIMLSVSLFVAFLLFRFIEEPSRNRLNTFFLGK